MIKHFSRISALALMIAMTLGLVKTVSRLRTDPTDDFSFSLSQDSGREAYRLMPEKRVTEILQDRLDLFPRSEAPKLARHLLRLCKQYRFDPAFVLSLIQVESGFRVKVFSPDGAVGLMQVMPATAVVTAQGLGVDLDSKLFSQPGLSKIEVASRLLTDPYSNLTFGMSYLAWLRDHYRDRSPYFLVAAYNIGPARMDELLTRKTFVPNLTKRYFNAIKRGVPRLRFYRRDV